LNLAPPARGVLWPLLAGSREKRQLGDALAAKKKKSLRDRPNSAGQVLSSFSLPISAGVSWGVAGVDECSSPGREKTIDQLCRSTRSSKEKGVAPG